MADESADQIKISPTALSQKEGLLIHDDGRVELADPQSIAQSPIYNHDLAPVAVSGRTWSTYNYIALWFSMSACIPTYMVSSGLIADGMNAVQAVFTILLGNTIVLLPIILNSHPGTKYGIPFPVFARAAYGTGGSNLPALMRALVACGWFGIQTWIGGQAFYTMFSAITPAWHNLLGGPYMDYMGSQWLSFAPVLGPEYFYRLPGHGTAKKGGRICRALCPGDDDCPLCLGGEPGPRHGRPFASGK